ncbi:MAG: M20/M25/M40 family metallo-hydrolase [Myxococcota bacterium]
MKQHHLDFDVLRQWTIGVREAYQRTLEQYVNIPSVSMEPERKGDVLRQAQAAVATLTEFGANQVELVPTKGNPVVFARFETDPSAPTVTIYNHLDVQPANEPEWTSEPFRFRHVDDRYFGRGATDDKGPALAALFGARKGLDDGARINVQILWELEEEIGSPNFAEALTTLGDRLRPGTVVVSDTIWIARGRPAVPAGLRGLQTYTFTLEVGATDQHSGTTGGAARNPVAELAEVAAACVDAKTGRCKVPGFYHDVVKPTKQELRDFAGSGFSVAQFMKDHGFKSIRTKDKLEVMKRIWALPTFELHGLVGGYAGPGVKTVIPPRAELKVSTRLVPDQRPEAIARLVAKHVKRVNKDVKVTAQHALRPYRGVTSGPHADAVKRAMAFAFGRAPVFVREGGSIGAVVTMQERLKAPVMFLGLSLPEHGYHAPNENFDWEQASGGMIAFAAYLHELAAMEK